FSVAGGSLPPGLTLAANGLVSGTPSTAGNFGFTVQAKDATNATGVQQYSVTIAVVLATPPSLQNFAPKKGVVGDPVALTGSGFTGCTDVQFGGGVSAAFTLSTDTNISATVPA